MEKYEKETTASPYKILKMLNGDDVLCKVLQEYTDALVVEMPMSIMKHQVKETRNQVVEHTGLHRWINYSNDTSHVIYKDRILSFGTLAPEVIFYYKMFCKKIRLEIEDNAAQTDDDIMEEMKDNLAKVAQYLESSGMVEREDDEEELLEDSNFKIPSRLLH